MSGRARRWAATILVLLTLGATQGARGQTNATLDLGFTEVRYDGFLASAAGSASPALRFERPNLIVDLRGTFLVYQSGHRNFQGNAAGSYFLPKRGAWRAEIATSAGASRYADFASFGHLIAGGRLHWAAELKGAWVGGTGGRTSYGHGTRPIAAFAAGVWVYRRALWMLSATTTRVGDTSYTDVEGTLRARRANWQFDGTLGGRAWSRGGGHGLYGEASLAFDISSVLALVASGGRYPTDPVRGSVSGRYGSLALRVTGLPRRRSPPQSPLPGPGADPPPAHHSAPIESASPVTMELQPGIDSYTLRVHAAATSVEIAGDFTDWDAKPLTPSGSTSWTLALRLTPGIYRFNLRIDGGEWLVPPGFTPVTDDFGGIVGLLTVR